VSSLVVASLSQGMSLQKRSGMALVVEGFHRPVHPRVYETYLPFAFPAAAGPIYRLQRDRRLSWPRHHDGE